MLNEDTPTSDHCALILRVDKCTTTRTQNTEHRFRFENAWLRDKECNGVRVIIIEGAWKRPVGGGVLNHLEVCAISLDNGRNDGSSRGQERVGYFACSTRRLLEPEGETGLALGW